MWPLTDTTTADPTWLSARVLAAPDSGWAVVLGPSPVQLGSFAHHFPPPQLSGPGLLTRTLTSLGFVWEFF